ncbi:phage integrase family protein [Chryseobacterium sp. 7]|uniref:tyrosine-type recombinase/integrase n=1 Tax=Chryseobacterium sp. 7 TaxID=2035214 RepID=UPI000EB3C1E3|nr:tyrosine-type recombinase/integrase [Chryseobacterium sp. 7]RLJ34191.1 phage integrase family protein [Chryseobacterium sp. 7]
MKRSKILLPNGCSCSTPSVFPKDWKTAGKKSLTLTWKIQYYFHDPLFKDKYPYGRLTIVKGMNEYKDIEDRRNATKILLENELKTLKEGYNPIQKKSIAVIEDSQYIELSPYTPFIKALELAYDKISASSIHLKQVKQCIARLKPFFERLKYDELKISEVKIWHIKNAFEHAKLTPSVYNKYRSVMMSLFKELIQYGCIEHNPCREISKQKTIVTIRETLSDSKYQIVHDYIEENYPDFFRYFKIFFLSGARTSELMRLQKKDVNLIQQEYKVIIRKGRQYTETIKVILPDAIPYWREILSMCKSENDYLFSKGLVPGKDPIQPYQITKRWYRLIKQSDNIKDENGNIIKVTEDFYALKHLFLDILDGFKPDPLAPDYIAIPDINLAKTAASHRTESITNVYTVGKKKRENEALKQVRLGIGERS